MNVRDAVRLLRYKLSDPFYRLAQWINPMKPTVPLDHPQIDVVFVRANGTVFTRRVPYMGQRWITVPQALSISAFIETPLTEPPRIIESRFEIERATFREVVMQ